MDNLFELEIEVDLKPAQVWTCPKCKYLNVADFVGKRRLVVCEECNTQCKGIENERQAVD